MTPYNLSMKNPKTTLLLKAGLTATQADTFAYLLEFGEQKASIVAKKIQRPRGVAYKALDELLELELVEKIEKSGNYLKEYCFFIFLKNGKSLSF